LDSSRFGLQRHCLGSDLDRFYRCAYGESSVDDQVGTGVELIVGGFETS
jgi:hypothetical protein